MSLQTLLVDFPNYSARKVRRLAKQVAVVQRVSTEFAMHDEVGILKGVEADLMEFNLLQARTESQLNDDVPNLYPHQKDAVQELKEKFTERVSQKIPHPDEVLTERICVTPVDAARKAVNEMAAWMRTHTDANLKKDDLEKLIQRCHGYINGQAFYTDRTFIQAKLSPQTSLELEEGARRFKVEEPGDQS